MKKNIIEFFLIVAMKFASLSLMIYVIGFIFYFGGLKELGIYSAITAVTIPLTVFASYRYIEWMALEPNKNDAFLIASSSAVLTYIFFVFFATPIFYSIHNDFFTMFFLIIYRPLELVSDIYVSFLVGIQKKSLAAISILSKFFLVIVISFLLKIFSKLDAVQLVALSVFLSYLSVFSFFDVPVMLHKRYLQRISFTNIRLYLKDNYHYGFLNTMVTLNSVIPRYYLTYIGSMESLGLFSFLYQISATLVNLIQYAVSIKIQSISKFMLENFYILSRIAAVLMVLILVLLFVFIKQPYNYASLIKENYLWSFFIISGMFVFLMYRGLLISIFITIEKGGRMNIYFFSAGLLAATLILPFIIFNIIESSIALSVVFVMMSCYITSLFIQTRIYKKSGLAND